MFVFYYVRGPRLSSPITSSPQAAVKYTKNCNKTANPMSRHKVGAKQMSLEVMRLRYYSTVFLRNFTLTLDYFHEVQHSEEHLLFSTK